MLAIRAYLLRRLPGQRGGYARFNSPGSRDATFGFQSFLEEHLNTSGFGIDEVDPRLLELVVAPLP